MIRKLNESKQTLKTNFGEKMWNKVKEKNNLPELSAESQRNLEEANQLLKTNSIVIYANHTSGSDAEVAVSIAISKLSNAKRFAGPAGMKHYDLWRNIKSRNTKRVANGILLRSLKLLNVNIIPVVQRNDLDYYPEKKRKKLISRLKLKTKRLFARAGSVYGITPEGTRNKETGELQKANTGIAKLEQYAPKNRPLIYLPISITFEEFSKKPQVVVGKPMALSKIMASQTNVNSDQDIADLHMYRLAELQEEKLRGYYK